MEERKHMRSFDNDESGILFANMKRTADEYQELSLEAARRSRLQFDQLANVALQALQNAVETANIIGKQSIGHRDIAFDAQVVQKPPDE